MLIKEFIQVLRDKRTRFMLFGPPIVQMLIFGYAATLEIKHVPTAIVDYDNTQASRDLISRFAASEYFTVHLLPVDQRQIPMLIDRGDVTLAMQINAGFAQNLGKGQTAHIQLIVDSSSSNTALIGLGYVNQVAGNFAQDYQISRLKRLSPMMVSGMPRVLLDHRPWYNTDLSDRWFFIPGVIGNLIMVMIVNLTAFAVVREREIGTLEQIMVTPIRRVEFILGKTVPFFLIGLLDSILVTVFGTLWFGVPLRGSIGVLAVGTILFLVCVLAIGLFISTISRTQQQALMTAFFFIMPAIVFSGFGTPISSMPEAMQWLTYLNPLRYFQEILRSVYLKGVGLDVLWRQMAAMGLLGLIMLTISVFRFQKSLD
ncbi:MAG TPA: ABC transporter permease [Candidatus Sulfobium mesophilum]|nr:ABC transporter permease [Candidatus Sulfobium mesophilum]